MPLQPRAVLPVAWHAPGRRVGRAPVSSHPPPLALSPSQLLSYPEALRWRATGPLSSGVLGGFRQACRAALDVQPTHTCATRPPVHSLLQCKSKRSLRVYERRQRRAHTCACPFPPWCLLYHIEHTHLCSFVRPHCECVCACGAVRSKSRYRLALSHKLMQQPAKVRSARPSEAARCADVRRTHCALEVAVRGGASRPRQSSAGCCGTSRTTRRLNSCCRRVCSRAVRSELRLRAVPG